MMNELTSREILQINGGFLPGNKWLPPDLKPAPIPYEDGIKIKWIPPDWENVRWIGNNYV